MALQPETLAQPPLAASFWLLSDSELTRARGGRARTDISTWTSGNTAEMALDTSEGFRWMAEEINATSGAQDAVDLVANTAGPLRPVPGLDGAATIEGLLQAAKHDRGVRTRFAAGTRSRDAGQAEQMLTLQRLLGAANVRLGLPSPFVHEKALAVRRNGSVTALVGGSVEMHFSRWDTARHDKALRARMVPELAAAPGLEQQKNGYVDRLLRLRGPAAAEVANSLVSRWDESETAQGGDRLAAVPVATGGEGEARGSRSGSMHVQLLRTRPCTSRTTLFEEHEGSGSDAVGVLGLVPDPTAPAASLAHAPRGETSVLAGFVHAISRAQRLVFIEDRSCGSYLPAEVFEALRAALAESPSLRVVVVGNEVDDARSAYASPTQRELLRAVPAFVRDCVSTSARESWRELARDHAHVRLYTRRDGAFVHAKTLLVDDVYLASGSANVDPLSLFSAYETSVGVVDEASVPTADGVRGGRAVVEWRLGMWAEHTGLPPSLLRNMTLDEALVAFDAPTAMVRRLPLAEATVLSAAFARHVCDRASRLAMDLRCRDADGDDDEADDAVGGAAAAAAGATAHPATMAADAGSSNGEGDGGGGGGGGGAGGGAVRPELIHIAKTGGTSLVAAAAERGYAWGVVSPQSLATAVCGVGSSHVPRAYYAAEAMRDPYAGASTLCVARHPYSRALSQYVYTRQQGVRARLLGMEADACAPSSLNRAVVDRLRPLAATLASLSNDGRIPREAAVERCHWLPQWLYVAPHERSGAQPSCEHPLRYENLSASFPALMLSLGHAEFGSVNLSARRINGALAQPAAAACPHLSVADLDEPARALLRTAYARDFELFGYDPW